MRAIIATLALFWSFPVCAQEYVINAFGASSRYNIFTVGADGWVNSFAPLPAPPGSVHTAWPSGIARNGTTTVYATVYLSRWDAVGRWSRTGSQWTYNGSVFASSSVEPHGIGPTWVGYDTVTSQFLMYYVALNSSQVGATIRLATSSDGIAWTRGGVVVSAGGPQSAGGLSMSYACRDDDGRYLLAYHGYDVSLQKGIALLATAGAPDGPFTTAPTLMRGDGWESTAWGRTGNSILALPAGASVPLGIPLLLPGGEVSVAQKQVGAIAHLSWPLRQDFSWLPIVSSGKNKVDPSYIKRTDAGWTGIWTLYGGIANRTAEYAVEVTAPSLAGPWTFSRTGLAIIPFFPEWQQSAENPQPIVSDMSCRS